MIIYYYYILWRIPKENNESNDLRYEGSSAQGRCSARHVRVPQVMGGRGGEGRRDLNFVRTSFSILRTRNRDVPVFEAALNILFRLDWS